MTYRVVVDGTDKGEVFKRAGRWFWRRGPVSVEPFARGARLDDVARWARKCCNGTTAAIRKPGSARSYGWDLDQTA